MEERVDMDSDKQAEPMLGYGMLHGVTDACSAKS